MKQDLITPYWQVVTTVAKKDLRAEIRGRELVSAMFLFAMMAVLIFSFALELDREAGKDAVAGVLWVTIIFSGMLGLSRSLAVEKDKGSLDALLVAPVHRSAIFYGKMLANFVFVMVIAVLLMLLLTILFNTNLFLWQMMIIILLGCVGFTTTGTLVASISIHARARETALPILLLPVVLPILLSAVRASTALLSGMDQAEWLPWLQILAMVDLAFLTATYFLFDYIAEV